MKQRKIGVTVSLAGLVIILLCILPLPKEAQIAFGEIIALVGASLVVTSFIPDEPVLVDVERLILIILMVVCGGGAFAGYALFGDGLFWLWILMGFIGIFLMYLLEERL